MKKRVLVACGTGIATSTIVNDAIETLCKEYDIDAEILQIKVADIPAYQDSAHLLVTTTIIDNSYPFPVIHARSFLTGMGVEETKREILEELQK
ncbi:PTS sugar transporter subunit IIB [Desmospora activa]|uniref:PTS system IIB component (Gat family) n=1 Tax=Desmospora activa DSM 45169 TaxID=1121389 RepID=A0A2T4Z991_9BACL|nr:PTS sugar transporter subunit IIB [Desmospora activa]PTM58464.1 PTS system IIB component (Gat family) [Desmospora activa DSM 45169]